MKFTCEKKKLHSALQLVSTVVPAKSPREILQNVLIDAREGCVQLAGTDLEVGIRFVVEDVNVEEEGTILTEAAQLTRILHEAISEDITFESTEGDGPALEFNVSYEESRYELKASDPEEYPDVPPFEGEHVEMEGALLNRMIEHTAFAAARESIRFAINGVLFAVNEGTAQMVGTDGHRLAWMKKKVEIDTKESFNGILPLKALDVLQRLLADTQEQVKLKLDENFILAKCGNGVVVSKLVEGSYPNYEEIIPRENDKIAVIDTAKLTSAVRQAAVLTGEESLAVRTSFEGSTMTMTSRIPQRGGATIKRQVDYEGEPVKIGFKPGYLLDLLKVTDAETIRIELKDKDRPALFKTSDDYYYVVMPVSIEE